MLNPIHLRTVAAVVRTGSFAAAAKELGYTSSAVSQQIASLEHDVRLVLFERRARSIAPTPAATFLADRSIEVLALLDDLQDAVGELAGGERGRLRIGSFPTASEHLLPGAIAELAARLPHVGIELEEAEPDTLVPRVSDRLLDVALVYEYDLVPRAWPRNLHRSVLLSEDLVLLLPQDHRLSGEVRLSELAGETWISTAAGTSGSECLLRLCAAQGFIPRVAFRTNDYDVVRRFVGAGLGVALVPRLGAAGDPHTRRVAVAGPNAQRHILAVRRRVGGSPLAAAALAALTRAANSRSGL
ncbi:LysR family transcriptional regulator [Pseudonocardia ailaonensis]|uniref:LysR family transcriptional regulator n=1 Tax=Pseudonocardia ailaonensis TaxID=367279 RepID=A0ABN2NGY1_9PSEU